MVFIYNDESHFFNQAIVAELATKWNRVFVYLKRRVCFLESFVDNMKTIEFHWGTRRTFLKSHIILPYKYFRGKNSITVDLHSMIW